MRKVELFAFAMCGGFCIFKILVFGGGSGIADSFNNKMGILECNVLMPSVDAGKLQ